MSERPSTREELLRSITQHAEALHLESDERGELIVGTLEGRAFEIRVGSTVGVRVGTLQVGEGQRLYAQWVEVSEQQWRPRVGCDDERVYFMPHLAFEGSPDKCAEVRADWDPIPEQLVNRIATFHARSDKDLSLEVAPRYAEVEAKTGAGYLPDRGVLTDIANVLFIALGLAAARDMQLTLREEGQPTEEIRERIAAKLAALPSAMDQAGISVEAVIAPHFSAKLQVDEEIEAAEEKVQGRRSLSTGGAVVFGGVWFAVSFALLLGLGSFGESSAIWGTQVSTLAIGGLIAGMGFNYLTGVGRVKLYQNRYGHGSSRTVDASELRGYGVVFVIVALATTIIAILLAGIK